MSVLESTIPILDMKNHHQVKINGPSDWILYQVKSSSYSNNSANWVFNPSSNRTIVDRCILKQIPVTITYTGTTTGSALLQSGYDALRNLPIASVTMNDALQINDKQFTMNVNQIVPYESRFWRPSWLEETTPFFPDNYSEYLDGVTSMNNPLGAYSNTVDGVARPRGSFPCVITNGATSATITATIVEPVFIPGLHMRPGDGCGFTNVKSLSLITTFAPSLNRLVSHAASNATISNISVTIGQPTLLVRFCNPPATYVPRPISYAKDLINYYVTTNNTSLASAATTTLTSSVAQLNIIPYEMLVFVRQPDSVLDYTVSDLSLIHI